MNRSKVAAGGLLAAVFVTGLIVGNAGSTAMAERDRAEERTPRTPYIERLQENLGLSAEQRQLIEAVLQEFRTTYRTAGQELRAEERRRYHEIRIDARSKIAETLDSTQAAGYWQIVHDDSVRVAEQRAERRRR